MAIDPVMRAIVRHWDSVEYHLTAAETERLKALLARYCAESAAPDDRQAVSDEIAALLLRVLPAHHPVRHVITSPNAVRSTDTLEIDAELLADLRRIIDDEAARLAAPSPAGPAPGASPVMTPEEIAQDAMARLRAAPALSAADLRSAGGDPGQQHLIRLDGRDGPRFPLFQFDASGRPHQLVLSINALLGADTDPWGVADWWLGSHAWLDRTPAESIGQVADDVLLATAQAIAEAD